MLRVETIGNTMIWVAWSEIFLLRLGSHKFTMQPGVNTVLM
jgi:hypothetical protein